MQNTLKLGACFSFSSHPVLIFSSFKCFIVLKCHRRDMNILCRIFTEMKCTLFCVFVFFYKCLPPSYSHFSPKIIMLLLDNHYKFRLPQCAIHILFSYKKIKNGKRLRINKTKKEYVKGKIRVFLRFLSLELCLYRCIYVCVYDNVQFKNSYLTSNELMYPGIEF